MVVIVSCVVAFLLFFYDEFSKTIVMGVVTRCCDRSEMSLLQVCRFHIYELYLYIYWSLLVLFFHPIPS